MAFKPTRSVAVCVQEFDGRYPEVAGGPGRCAIIRSRTADSSAFAQKG